LRARGDSRQPVDVDALLLGRRTYVTHAAAFEPMPPGDPFGDLRPYPSGVVELDYRRL